MSLQNKHKFSRAFRQFFTCFTLTNLMPKLMVDRQQIQNLAAVLSARIVAQQLVSEAPVASDGQPSKPVIFEYWPKRLYPNRLQEKVRLCLIHVQSYRVFYHSLTFSITEFGDLMLIVCMIWIPVAQEIKFWISQFILSNTCLKFRTISCYETSGLIDNIFLVQNIWLRKISVYKNVK